MRLAGTVWEGRRERGEWMRLMERNEGSMEGCGRAFYLQKVCKRDQIDGSTEIKMPDSPFLLKEYSKRNTKS